jgi:hypothetical protein
MATYLFTARDRDGRQVTEAMEAPSADWVVLKLNKDGYTDIVLHTENVSANYTKMVEGVSPKQYVKFRRKPSRLIDTWRAILGFYWSFSGICLAATALFAYRRWAQLPFHPVDIACPIALVLPLVFAIVSQLQRWVYTYNRMVGALGWGRWQEVLDLAAKLDGKVPPEELAFRRARALCGLGRAPEAFALLKPFGDGQAMPLWMYHARLGEIYAVLKQPEKIVEHAELAVQLAPADPTALLDLAGVLLRYQPDLPRVERLLDEVRSHAISDVLSPIVEMTEGQLKLELGKANESRLKLENALQRWESIGLDEAIGGPISDRAHLYLALAYGRLGDLSKAREHYERAEPRLRALDSVDLLERCSRELRLPAKATIG